MNIAFITSGHLSYDDRIYYHLAATLSEKGHKILIISSKEELSVSGGNILINSFQGECLSKRNKINEFISRLNEFGPDVAICSEPLPVLAAKRCRRAATGMRVIYDITEWYPSARFLKEYHPSFRWAGFLVQFFLNLYACILTDAFLFGEYYKAKPYRLFFPFKTFTYITYYPGLKYISYREPSLSENKIRLSYSGELCSEKGFDCFARVVNRLADKYKSRTIEVKLITWPVPGPEWEKCRLLISNVGKNVKYIFRERVPFPDFTREINETDIFLDLRKITFENNHSLPIKLFCYAALGRPIIISGLKAVKRDVEINKFGYIVNPGNTDRITDLISGYIDDPVKYLEHCKNARALSLDKYNWDRIAPEFVRFIES
jgi:glycosyltransferase involved in cell wall biosynthesis